MAIERRIVTVLFADLVGFTSLSERLDAEDVASVQDAYFGLVRETVTRHGGQLEKFIGDAAMAVFGLARARDDDAERAVRAGLALTNAVEALSGRLGLEVGELRLRVGINTGEVVTAEQGPDRGRATGDTVNSAARLQAAAPPGGVLIGELTALAVADAIELEPQPPLMLKGKQEPVRASLATGIRLERSREEAMGGLRAPLQGREREVEQLAENADRARDGAIANVLVVAPPGVGKTRLTDEFLATLTGFAILRTRLRPDSGSPFEAVAQLMRGAFGGRAARDLAALVMERARAHGVSQERAETIADDVAALMADTGEPPAKSSAAAVASADRTALFDAWLTALDASSDGPIAWLIEDLHWAGPDLLAFLEAVHARPRPAGRLVIATTRPSLLERLAPDHRWTTLDLGALEPADAGALIVALVGPALPAELIGRIVERSDGNCLFIEELLRTWISVGTLVPGDRPGAWRLAVPIDEAPLPSTVQSIYAGQLDDLPMAARNAARSASVAGRRFPERALGTLGVGDVPEAIDVLGRRALISGPTSAPITGDTYAYRHALLRDAAYASLARAERARLHVRLARWLESTAGVHADELADAIATHHEAAVLSAPALATDVGEGVSRASAMATAAAWLERAGERSLAHFANSAAQDAFARAIVMTAAADRLDLARRWKRLGDATERAGDLDEAASAFATSSALFRAVLEDTATADAARTIARRGLAGAASAESTTRYAQIRFIEARTVAEAALEATGTEDALAAIPLQLARIQGLEGLTNDYTGLAEASRKVLDLAQTTGDAELIFQSRKYVLDFGDSRGPSGVAEWLESAADAGRLGFWQDASDATLAASGLASHYDRTLARSLADDAEQIAEARGLTEELAWVGHSRAELELVAGDWPAALRHGSRTLELAELHRFHRAAIRTWFVVTPIAWATGDRDWMHRAQRWFGERSTLPSGPTSPYGAVQSLGVNLRFAAFGLADEPVLDREALLAGFAVPSGAPSWLCSIEGIVRASLDRAQFDLASDLVDVYHAVDQGEPSGHELASHALVRGWVAQARGSDGEAADAFREAYAAAREPAAPWWVLRAVHGLESVGAATLSQSAGATSLERSLGIEARP